MLQNIMELRLLGNDINQFRNVSFFTYAMQKVKSLGFSFALVYMLFH